MPRHIDRRRVLQTGGAVAGSLGLAGAAAAQGGPGKPNIVFIMADDLGYADLGCYGARTIRTPNLDALAAAGLRLTDGYANSAVCSPTRMALITGRYQYRVRAGLEEPMGGPGQGLSPSIPTLPSLLQRLGYSTALVGKWHLGALPNYGPLKSGYQRFFGIPDGGADYFSHSAGMVGPPPGGARPGGSGPPPGAALPAGGNALTEDERTVERDGYLTDLLGDRAAAEIDAAAASGRPLFLSLHFTAPHWPWEGPEDEAVSRGLKSQFHIEGGDLATYGRMVESMDANIGKVLAALDRNGMAKDTLVVFTSDNGGERFSDVWPFTGGKTELLEGGIRVPLIVRWPARIAAGGTSGQVMVSMDFLPTLLAAAGGRPDPSSPSDGENLLEVLTGRAAPRPRKLFWRYKAGEQAAVRDGTWKYLKIRGKEFLFNLAQDQRERANLASVHPERLAQMKADHAAWNGTMLPYPAESVGHNLGESLADR